jgi:hypothetical protein
MKTISQLIGLRGGRFRLCGVVRSSLTSITLLALGTVGFAQTAFLRVNQVGYPSNATKRAYLMTSITETGATFAVVNSSNQTLYSSAIGARVGSWGSFSNVYALDFDGVTTAGTYTIKVTGPAPLRLIAPRTCTRRRWRTACTTTRTSATGPDLSLRSCARRPAM